MLRSPEHTPSFLTGTGGRVVCGITSGQVEFEAIHDVPARSHVHRWTFRWAWVTRLTNATRTMPETCISFTHERFMSVADEPDLAALSA